MAVCVCPCVSVSTHRTSVAVHQYTYQHVGPWTQHAEPSRGLFGTSVAVRVCQCVSISTHRTSVCVRQHTQDVSGCPWVSVSTHRTSVAVHQYTYQHVVHTGRPWVSASTHRTSVAVRVCPSLSVRTHRTSGDFGPRGLSVQYTQDVRGGPSAHTGRLWVSVSTHRTSVDVRVCPCVSVRTHRTSVAVHQYTYQHYTQEVRGCPPAHTGRPWLSMCVRVCPFVSVSTHRTSVAVHQYTYQHVGPWTQHAGPSRGLFGTHMTSVAFHQYTYQHVGPFAQHVDPSRGLFGMSVAVRVCPSVSVRTHRTSVAAHQYTYRHVVPWTQHAGPSRGLFGTSVAVRQHTQDVRGCPCVSVCVRQHTQDVCVCPSAQTGRPWLFVCVRVCLSAHTGCTWLSISTHISTLVLVLSTLTLPVDCSGDFCPRVLSVQYTQDVCGCLPAHTGRLWLSVCVRLCPLEHTGRPWLPISTHIGTLVLGLSTLALPVDCLGDFGPRGLSVQYTQDVRGCRSAHTGRLWVSVSTHRTSMAVCVCPCVSVSTHRTSVAVHHTHITSVGVRQHTQDVSGCLWQSVSTHRTSVAVRVCLCVSVSTHRTSVCVRQHTQDVSGCPCVSVSTHRTSVAVHQYTYQHVGPFTQHVDPSRGLFGTSVAVRVCPSLSVRKHRTSVAAHHTHRTSVGVRQHTQGVCGCLPVHTGRPWLYVFVRVCPSAHTGRLWLSISTHISTLVLGLSTLTPPVDCSDDFRQRGLSVQYTHYVRGCPPAHTGRPWLSVAVRQHRQDVCGSPCVSVCVRQHTQDVRGFPSAHTGRPGMSVCVRVCPSAHTGRPWLSISTHISTLVLVLSTLTLPVDCSGDFGPHGLSVQYTQDVRGCLPAHTGRPWLSVCVRLCPSAHTGRLWLSISTHISTLVLGLSTLALPEDCLGDFWPTWAICSVQTGRLWVSVSTHMTSVAFHQYTYQHVGPFTQHVDPSRGLFGRFWPTCAVCSVHTGRPWVSTSTHRMSVAVRVCPSVTVRTHRTSVAAHQYTYRNVVPWTQHAGPSRGLFGASVGVRQYTQDVRGCMCLSMCVRQHTQDVRGCPSVHISARCTPITSVGVRQHTQDVRGCLWLSVSTHRTSVAVRVCPCVSVSTHRTSVGFRQHTQDVRGCLWVSVCVRQHTQDVCGCPSVHISALHTGRSWVSASTYRTSVAVHVCPCVSVCVRQHTQDVRGCPSVHISARWSLDSARWPFPRTVWVIFGPRGLSVQYTQDVCGCPPAHTGRPWLSVAVRQHTQDVRGCPCVSVCVRQHTQDVCVCPSAQTGRPWLFVCVRVCLSAHTGCPWLSISTHISTLVLVLSTLTLPVDCSGDFCPRVLSVQYTQDVRGCLPAHTGRLWLSVCVCLCPSEHTGRPWLPISTHIGTLVLGLSTLALPVDCLGDFGPRGLSVQYTQDVRGCPSAHTGRLWVSVSTHRTSMAVCVCPCVSVSTHRTSVAVHHTHITSVGVRQHTQDVSGCLWQSVSTHRTSVAVRVCLCVSVSTHRTSVCVRQHTQDVSGCPCVSVSTHRTSVAVHQYTYQHVGPFTQHVDPSRGLFGTSVAVRVCPSLSVRKHRTSVAAHHTHRTSVGVRQHTQGVCGCLSVHTGRLWLYVFVRVCPSAHTGRLWLSISTHISTLVLGLSTLTPPVDCSDDFRQRGLSVQYTHYVRGCLPAHTGRPWLSVAVRQHRQDVCGSPCVSVCVRQHTQDVHGFPSAHTGRPWMSVCVRECLSAHTGRPWLSISTHISTLVLVLSTLTLPVGVHQHTQDVCGCPSVCSSVSVRTHRTSVAAHQYTYRNVVPWTQHAGPSRGLFGASVGVRQYTQDVRGCMCLSMCVRQHTQDVRGCPSVHISARCTPITSVCVRQHTQDVRGCLWLSVSTHRTSVAVRVCLCVSVSTHRTSVGFRQHTQDVRGCPWVSVCVRQHTQDVCGCPSVHISARWLSVQYTQDVRGCPPAHIGRLWLSMCVRVCPFVSVSTHRTSVAVHHTHRTSVGVRQHTQDVHGCPWLSVSTHRTSVPVRVGPCGSVCVRRHTQDVRGCPSSHTGRPCVSVSKHKTYVSVFVRQHTQNVRGCPSVHISARWSLDSALRPFPWTVRVILAHVGCLFCTHRISVGVRQHTQDIRGCPSAHTGRPWLYVFVRVCPSAHTGRPWLSISTHISTLVLGLSMLTLPVDCSGDFGPRGLSVQYTHYVRGCPPAHTGRPWLSVAVRHQTQDICVCPSAHTGREWLSECVCQHTQDVRGCPSVHISALHTGRPWVSASTHRTSVAVCVCLSVSVRTHRTSVAAHHTHRTSVGVRQHTQGVCGCPSVHTGRPWLYVFVRVCPSAHTGRPWLSIGTHISKLVLGLSTLTPLVDCSGDFGQRGLSVQYTHYVHGCPPAHTGRPWLSVAVHQHTQDVRGYPCVSVSTDRTSVAVRVFLCVSVSTHRTSVAVHHTHKTSVGVRQHTQDFRGCPCLSVCVRVCPCVSVSTQRTSVAVHQYTYQHVGPCTQHADPSRGLFGTSVAVCQHTQDVCGCPCVSMRVRRHIEDVRGSPSSHTGCPWVSVSTHRTSMAVHQYTYQHVGPWTQHTSASHGLFGTSVAVCQHTQDVCGCPCVSMRVRRHIEDVRGSPSSHTGCPWVSVSTHRTSMAVHHTHRTSVGVRQHTQDVRGCPSAHTGRPWVSVSTQDVRGCPCVSVCVRQHTQDVRGCPSAHTGRPWLSIITYISTLVLGLSTLTLPVDSSGDFGPRGLSVQYTHYVCGCPPAHTGRPWLSVSTHRTSVVVRVCLCVSVSTHRMSVGFRQHTQDVRGCPCVSVSTHRTSVAVHQYTYQHVGPWTQHTSASRGLFGTSVGVCQHTQDVRGCPSAHRTSVAVRVCLCVSVSTHRTSVAVHRTHRTSVGVRQHTQEVCGCPCVSVCVRLCPSAHTGRLWLSISTHISTLVLGLSTLALPVDCLGDFWPTWAVCSVHTGLPWVSASTHRTSVAVRGSLCVSVRTHRTSVAVHQYTYRHVGPWTQHAGPSRGLFGCFLAHVGCLFSTHRTSVGVRQHTQDVCGCLCVSVGTHRTSVGVHHHTQDVRGCPSAHTRRPWLSISTHLSTLVLGLSTLALPVDCSGDFGPRGLSVQYTEDVCGCPSAHTGRPWVSVSTHRTSVGVLHTLRLWVSARTHRTSVAVRQHTQDVCGHPWLSVCVRVCPSAHTGRPWLSISTHISTLVLVLSTLTLPVDCSGDFGPRGLSVQYTQDVRGCPPAHLGHPWLSVSTHKTSVTVRVCLCMSMCVHQHTQDVCGCPCVSVYVRVCPSAHTGRPWLSVSTHRTSVAVRVCPCVSVGTQRMSVGVHHHTQDVRVCPSAHTGRPWLSISTHISTLVLGLSTLALPVDCSGDFGPRGLSVQYTQDVHGCPSAHTGGLWVSGSTHRTSVGVRHHTQNVRGCLSAHRTSVAVLVCPCVSVCVRQHTQDYTQDVRGCPPAHTGRLWLSVAVCVCPFVSVRSHRTSVAVHQYTYRHVGPWTQHAGPSRGLFG
ncbi:hypothetical protein YC2023_066252 [Brassica napus]